MQGGSPIIGFQELFLRPSDTPRERDIEQLGGEAIDPTCDKERAGIERIESRARAIDFCGSTFLSNMGACNWHYEAMLANRHN